MDRAFEDLPNDLDEEFDDDEGPSARWVVGTQHSVELPNECLNSSHSSCQRIDMSFEHSVPFFNVIRGSRYVTFEENEHLAVDNWSFSDEFKKGIKFSTKRDLIYAIKMHHIMHHYNFCEIDSNKKKRAACCSQRDEGCPWRLCAC